MTKPKEPKRTPKESAEARTHRFIKMGQIGAQIMFHLKSAEDFEKRAGIAYATGLETTAKAYMEEKEKELDKASALWGVDCGK